MNKLWLTGALVLLLCAAGCNGSRKLSKGKGGALPGGQPLPENTRKLLAELDKAAFRFTDLEIKGKGRFQDASNKQSFTYKLRIEHGKAIWLSVTVIGFEGLRILATPEEVQVLNRLQNTYIPADYAWVSEKVGLQVDYHTLEHLILGNFPVLASQVRRAELKGEAPRLFCETEQASAEIVINKAEMRPATIIGNLRNSPRKSTLNYQEYQALVMGRLPFLLHLQVEGDTRLEAQLQHKNVTLNSGKLSIPFVVPDDYQVVKPR
ncbi:MAG: DUF4292 domain-containing protein [Bacteroidetes bacterium]|nr:DUF4292 domain-containing protein [Bacteroidota bacterium]